MELAELEKKRDGYAGKIVKLGFTIAVIFLVPALIAVLLSRVLNLSFLYFFPVAFVVSWSFVVGIYRRYAREVRELDRQIALHKKETSEHTSL